MKEMNHRHFRETIWARDAGRSRASGKPLTRSSTDGHVRGEVHHVIARSIAPQQIFDPSNGLLLSRFEHALAEAICPNDPQHHYLEIIGPIDRGQLQRFVWRSQDGTITKERIG